MTDNLNSGGLLLSGFCFKHRILLHGFDCPELKILLGAGMEDGCTPPCPVGGSSHATHAGTESQQSVVQSCNCLRRQLPGTGQRVSLQRTDTP